VSTIILQRHPDPRLVSLARIRAAASVHDGRDSPASQRYLARCYYYHQPTLTAIIFTRDTGHNSSGWWKNPDYERCYHLSLRFLAYERGIPLSLPYDWKMAKRWVEAFFADDAALTWHEGPFTDIGKSEAVHHYRLFCDPAWQPLKPRGEVYSKDWTPADWKSFSDAHGDQKPAASC
jgi:hypothetical protein